MKKEVRKDKITEIDNIQVENASDIVIMIQGYYK
jgi:hypothetical protein